MAILDRGFRKIKRVRHRRRHGAVGVRERAPQLPVDDLRIGEDLREIVDRTARYSVLLEQRDPSGCAWTRCDGAPVGFDPEEPAGHGTGMARTGSAKIVPCDWPPYG